MENFEKCADIFAILTPVNNAARDCFSQVAQKKVDDEKWNPSARMNIKANELPVQVSTYTSGSESNGDSEPLKTFRPVLKGCYTFNFVEAPRQPSKGWLIGGGKFSEDDESPDILLTERKKIFGVSSRHARLAHNFTSGALVMMVSDSSPVSINGHEVIDAQHVIHGRTTSLEFGALKYSLEIRKYDTDEDYRSHLRYYKNKHGIADDDYPLNLLATPADSDLVTQKYVLKNPIGDGSTCVVYAAYDRRNGTAVAVKKIRRTKINAKHVEQDIYISKHIGFHARVCHLIETIDPAADDPNRGYKMFGVDEVFLVYTPLASWTIQNFIDVGKDLNVKTREKIFWQLLEGIEYLHSVGVMHRDIKPPNMTVVSLNTADPDARLIDFGSAKIGLQSDQYRIGTLSYLAPEVLAGLRDSTTNEYNEKVDIFAFGLSMFQFFCRQPCCWQSIDTDANGNISGALLSEIKCLLYEVGKPRQLMEWIAACMNWDPQSRPSAKDLWDIRDEIQSQSEKTGDSTYHGEKGIDHDEKDTDHDEKDDGGVETVASTEKPSLREPEGISHDRDSAIEGSQRGYVLNNKPSYRFRMY